MLDQSFVLFAISFSTKVVFVYFVAAWKATTKEYLLYICPWTERKQRERERCIKVGAQDDYLSPTFPLSLFLCLRKGVYIKDAARYGFVDDERGRERDREKVWMLG